MSETETIEAIGTELVPISEAHLNSVLLAAFIESRFKLGRSSGSAETGETATPDEVGPGLSLLRAFGNIESLISVARLRIGDRAADRLIFLRKEERDLEPGERAMSEGSLRHFLDFLLYNEKLRNCLIGVAPNGNLHAEWHAGDDRHAVIEFLPSGSVRYAAICPNPDDVSTPKSVSGTVPLSDIFEALAPYEFAERAA